MQENRAPDVAAPSSTRAVVVEPPKRLRAKLTNNPLSVRASRNTALGRRVADLFRAFVTALGSPVDTVTLSNVLAAAELKAAAEVTRAKLLAGGDIDPDQVVKLEGAAARAERKLGLAHRAPEVRGMTLGDVLKGRRDG